MTARWNTPTALAALLDALEADLLNAPKEDVRVALRETCRAKEGAVREIRLVLHDAERDSDDGHPLALPFYEHIEVSTKLH